MSNHAPWPVRKGIFRSSGQSDYVPQRTPSPIVEMPNTPQPGKHSANPMSPRVSIVEHPFSPPQSPITMQPINKSIREIPIEVQLQEVYTFILMNNFYF